MAYSFSCWHQLCLPKVAGTLDTKSVLLTEILPRGVASPASDAETFAHSGC